MVAVDAMGGDKGPKIIVEGALSAAKQGIAVKLFGKKDLLVSVLHDLDRSWGGYDIELSDSKQVIAMGESPVLSVSQKKDSSLVNAVSAVKDGTCSAVMSAGNSGALMIASSLILGRQTGVSRPAIVGILPSCDKKVYCLDIGANSDCNPENLLQFAFLGLQYFKKVESKTSPSVGLLNIGHEEGKGSLLAKRAFELLKQSGLNFIGNIEPENVFAGKADIVVCDGFSGNIVLKTTEALLKRFKGGFEISPFGGAVLLGVDGIVVFAHGNSTSLDVEKAIFLAYNSSLKEKNFHGVFKKSVGKLAN